MNFWQVLRQIQYLLRQQNWTGTSTPVFHDDSVQIVAGESDIEALEARLILPSCLIIPGGGASDPVGEGEQPDLISRSVSIVLMARNENDDLGSGAIMGAAREGLTDSRGRGVEELEEEVFNAIKKLSAESGIVIALRMASEPETRKDQEDNSYAFQEYSGEVNCAANRYYFPGRRLAATPTSGEVSLTWTNPPTRFDTYRMRLVRKAGSSAPTSPSDGTELALSANMATSKVDSGLPAGTYSYSLFASYDDFNPTPGTDLSTSAAVSVTGVVVP